jgi:hypothetical protein
MEHLCSQSQRCAHPTSTRFRDRLLVAAAKADNTLLGTFDEIVADLGAARTPAIR